MNNKVTLCSGSSVDQLVRQLSFWNLFKKQIKVGIYHKLRFPDLGPGSNGCKSIGDRFRGLDNAKQFKRLSYSRSRIRLITKSKGFLYKTVNWDLYKESRKWILEFKVTSWVKDEYQLVYRPPSPQHKLFCFSDQIFCKQRSFLHEMITKMSSIQACLASNYTEQHICVRSCVCVCIYIKPE